MHNDDISVVRYTMATKALLIIAPAIFLGIAIFVFRVAVSFREAGFIPSIMFAGIGVWFLRVGYFSVQGLRFINIEISIRDWGLEVQGLPQPRSIRWPDIGKVTRDPIIQVLSVRDQSDRVIFIIDYWIRDFTRLDSALKEAGHT